MSSELPYSPSGEASNSKDPPEKKEGDDEPEKWDAPPDKEPSWPAENTTTLILVHRRQLLSIGKEVAHIRFSSFDEHIAAMVPFGNDDWHTLCVWDSTNFQRMYYRDLKILGDFALAPAPDRAVIVPFQQWIRVDIHSNTWGNHPAVAIHDLEKRKQRMVRESIDLQAPLVYSPDGTLVAAVDLKDNSRITICTTRNLQPVLNILHHTEEVTNLAFSPDSTSLVSVSKDG